MSESLKDCEAHWFLLWPLPQQVGCSSAEGLVIRVAGRGGTEREESGLRGLVGVKGWQMGLRANAKTINPTSAWPQDPIKFIYIFTLRPPPLKRLCLDISEQRDVPIYLTELSQRTGSWDSLSWLDPIKCISAARTVLQILGQLGISSTCYHSYMACHSNDISLRDLMQH